MVRIMGSKAFLVDIYLSSSGYMLSDFNAVLKTIFYERQIFDLFSFPAPSEVPLSQAQTP